MRMMVFEVGGLLWTAVTMEGHFAYLVVPQRQHMDSLFRDVPNSTPPAFQTSIVLMLRVLYQGLVTLEIN